MTILTPSPSPATLFTRSSTVGIIKVFSPSIIQRLNKATLFVFLRAYISSLFILRQTFYASQMLLFQGYYASALLGKQCYPVAQSGMKTVWKASESFRDRLFFEFMVFILGGGYHLLLLVLWPGWFVIGGAIGLWWMCG